jgi:hypothetical protein
MGGDGWLAGPKGKSFVQGGMHHLLAVCFHRVISRWPLLVLESPSPSHPPADYSYSLCFASCHHRRRRSRRVKKATG